MESSFSDRIEADIRRGIIASVEDEERAQLERWIVYGVNNPEGAATRFAD